MDDKEKDYRFRENVTIAGYYVPVTLFSLMTGSSTLLLGVGALALMSHISANMMRDRNIGIRGLAEMGFRAPSARLSQLFDEVAREAEMEDELSVSSVVDDKPNAMANPISGKIAVTTALENQMDDEELKYVLAHEIGHMKQREGIVMDQTFSTPPEMITWGLLLFGLMGSMGPAAATGLPMALATAGVLHGMYQRTLKNYNSRIREYDADYKAIKLTNNFNAAASALEKVNEHTADRQIENWPELAKKVTKTLLFTHPTNEERIAKMREAYIELNGHEPPPQQPPEPPNPNQRPIPRL